METRHPVEGQFGGDFQRSVIIAELRRPEVAILRGIFVFVKTTPYDSKIFKILLLKFSPPHRTTLLCSNVVKFVRRDINEIMRYLHDKTKQNFGCLSNCPCCTHCAQNLLGPAPNNVLRMFQISSKSVHFRQSNSRTCQHSFLSCSVSMIRPKLCFTAGK